MHEAIVYNVRLKFSVDKWLRLAQSFLQKPLVAICFALFQSSVAKVSDGQKAAWEEIQQSKSDAMID